MFREFQPYNVSRCRCSNRLSLSVQQGGRANAAGIDIKILTDTVELYARCREVVISGCGKDGCVCKNVRNALSQQAELWSGAVIGEITGQQNEIGVLPLFQSLAHRPGLPAQVQITCNQNVQKNHHFFTAWDHKPEKADETVDEALPAL